MTDTIKIDGFSFGTGAFREDGAPVVFEFDNCKPTYWVRALDATMVHRLSEEYEINLDQLHLNIEFEDVPELDDEGNEIYGEDGEVKTKKVAKDPAEAIRKWTVENAPKFGSLCTALIVRFEGLIREDNTPIACNEETIRAHGGWPEFGFKLIDAAAAVAKGKAKNSDSSSDGNAAQTVADGEPISSSATTKE